MGKSYLLRVLFLLSSPFDIDSLSRTRLEICAYGVAVMDGGWMDGKACA
jgi:hypothetical protein